jgi:hypothetical protein
MPSISWATTYYVTTTGSNSADGSVGTPWLTIQHAADTMSAGDTVLVATGTYAERVVTAHAGTDASHYIIFKTTASAQILGFNISHDYVRVEGFTITNTVGSACTSSCDDSASTYAGVYIGGNYAQVVGNYIYNIGMHAAIQPYHGGTPSNAYISNNHIVHSQYGIIAYGTNWTVQGNDVEEIVKYSTEGGWDCDYMRFFGSGHVFSDNYLHGSLISEIGTYPNNCHLDCFQTFDSGSAPPSYNITMERNVCTDAADFLMAEGNSELSSHDFIIRNNILANTLVDTGSGNVINIKDIEKVTIVNNTFYNFTAAMGVYVHEVNAGYMVNFLMKNNIFLGTGIYAYGYNFLEAVPATIVSDYNLLQHVVPDGGRRSDCVVSPGIGIGGCNDVTTTDILFVNPTVVKGTDGVLFTHDDGLNIQSGSPAKGAGADLTSLGADYALDILGVSRTSSWDIGCFEYTPTSFSGNGGLF